MKAALDGLVYGTMPLFGALMLFMAYLAPWWPLAHEATDDEVRSGGRVLAGIAGAHLVVAGFAVAYAHYVKGMGWADLARVLSGGPGVVP